MKKIQVEFLFKNVKRAIFSPFNYHNSWEDRQWFSNVTSYLFETDDSLIGIGYRENSFYVNDDKLKSLRESIPSMIAKSGGYYRVLSGVDPQRFSSIFSFKYSEDLLVKMWTYFEFFCVFRFSGHSEIDKKYIQNFNKISFKSIKEILEKGESQYIITKTSEDDELGIDYINEEIIEKLSLINSR